MFTQYVDRDDQYVDQGTKAFNMIDNYVYLYHTDTLIAIPLYPDSIQDSMGTSYAQTPIMSRSAPIFSYSNSGPRVLQIQLPLHRDMMHDVNTSNSKLDITELESGDYVDLMINQLQAAAVPSYAVSEKMVNPPLVAVRFGNSIFCKGVVLGGITVTHSGPIIQFEDNTDKYAVVTIGFSVYEVDPYDANTIMLEGGYRGLRTTLDTNIYVGSSAAISNSFGSTAPPHSRGFSPATKTPIAIS